MEARGECSTMASLSRYCRKVCGEIRTHMLDCCSISRCNPYIGEAEVVALCRAMLENPGVKKIYFNHDDLPDDSLASLSASLSSCESLEEVELRGRNAMSLLPSIAMNDSIRRLRLEHCQADAAALARMIRLSKGLKKLRIEQSAAGLPHYSAYSADELATIGEACRHNQSIEELCLGDLKEIPLRNTLLSNLGPKLTRLELNGSCDGAAVGSLLRNSQRLRTLAFRFIDLSPEDCLAIKDGLSQSFSLRELEMFDCKISMGDYVLVGDMIRAASHLEKFGSHAMNTQAWHSIFESLAHHSNIRNIDISPAEGTALGSELATLLERNSHLQDLALGDLSVDGLNGLARGLAATTSLVDLKIRLGGDIRAGSFRLLCEQGLSQCPTLERLVILVRDCNLYDSSFSVSLLSQIVKENRTLRCLYLNYDSEVEGRNEGVLTAIVDALELNDVLKEFRLRCWNIRADEELTNKLSSILPKLWKMKTLELGRVQLLKESDRFIRELDLNMGLTELNIRTSRHDYELWKQINRIVKRNQALDAADYGLTAAPSLWPAMIHLALRNEHVGPSMVYRLLSDRSGDVASYVPMVNVRPASDGCQHDGRGQENGVARRRMK